ncbi:MAG: transcription elongation factor GreA [Chloroflexota bacterium]|jgi:transcription elongation factor GreA|nr:transcription elongation factor GreA [Chloroflexia bacterium]MDQ3442584.1 transcription elongation factor GreA [Chloroflexota bacterium]
MDNKPIPVTREGFERLTGELRELTDVKRPEIVAAVAEARSHGDLRENAAYDAARQDQAMIEKRIIELEGMLRNAKVIDASSAANANGLIGVGSKVTVDFDGEDEQYTLVGAIEAQPAAGLISTESPIGRQLVGKKAGDSARVETPGGSMMLTIKAVE